jgi:pimeloyl-ACP methyl ester carboxylesterase
VPTTTMATLQRTTSRDGTPIGYWTTGQGSPLLLVHGGFGDHRRWDALRPHLEPHVTVHAMDRRGRGASGDQLDYDVDREFEDVAAVVDAIARDAGEPVNVYGSSYGGMCALGAATLTRNMRRLVLYEGWVPMPPEFHAPPGFIERTEQMLADGDREGALVAGYRTVVHLSDEEIEHLRSRPEWPARVDAAHTLPREERAAMNLEFDADRLGRVAVPTLLLIGDQSPDLGADELASALPDARIRVLEGQAHVADLFAPQVVAQPLLQFIAAGSPMSSGPGISRHAKGA